VQIALGWLPPWSLELIGAHLRVPKSEAFGIASSFPDLRLSEPPEQVVRVCRGASCRQRGATLDVEQAELADCLFICGVGPATEVDGRLLGRPAEPVTNLPQGALVQDGTCSRAVAEISPTATRVGCAGNCWQAPAWSVDGGTTWTSHAGERWQQPGAVRLLRTIGRVDPLIGAPNAYEGLDRALELGSDAVWELVKASGLRGRGGAYFPVGAKWETARNTAHARKILLVNAEEGEPGIYKDRHLLEGDPHRVLEGIQIAALGIGATDVVIFVNGEAHLARERLLAALERTRGLGVERVPVEVRLGSGGYVLGEETALINTIHGQRAEPLARPPFPAVSGLYACPTVINNVETLTNLPDILLQGVEWFRSTGSAQTPGTKLVSLAGAVRRPGLYEAPLGTPLRTIVDAYGGGVIGTLGAVLVGGPSGSILPPELLDTPFDVHDLQAVGGVLGAGGIVPLTADQCPVAAVRELSAYNARESCGKCTPCREGTVRMLAMFDDLPRTDLATLNDLNDVLAFGSLCGLGQMAPNPVRALLRHFGDIVAEHLRGDCRTGACQWSS
jgi:NADH:ubiquinone oxidoreductase subunit F (NADH-binding)